VVKAKRLFTLSGVRLEGPKELIGIYFGDHESSTFWRQLLMILQLPGLRTLNSLYDNLKACHGNRRYIPKQKFSSAWFIKCVTA